MSTVQELLTPYSGEIAAFCLTLVAALIFWLFRAKVKLIWGRSNNSLHFVTTAEGKAEIYCEKFFLQNTGRKPARDIEFVLNGKPDDFSIWQPRDYKMNVNPEGALVVSIPFISPYELVIIDTVYINRAASSVISVKCSEALGKNVPFVTNRNFGAKFNFMMLILLLLGIAFIIRIIGIAVLG
jgi:hypothetical protein